MTKDFKEFYALLKNEKIDNIILKHEEYSLSELVFIFTEILEEYHNWVNK